MRKSKRKVNKKRIIKLLMFLVLIVAVAIIVFKVNNDSKTILKGVVVRVYDTNMMVMGTNDTLDLYTVEITNKESKKFKQGQEILIYTNGTAMTTYPVQLGKAKKIKIVKEKSETEIPNNILKYCYSSRDNVDILVDKLTATGLTLTITDKNDLPYNYYTNYKIYKKVKNPDYTGEAQKIGEDTESSTSGSTRNRNRIYMERN